MLRLLTAGESHGPEITAILDGFPAGLSVDLERINTELRRRQSGPGSGARMTIETDTVRITGGVLEGRTTGAPLALMIRNDDHTNWAGREIAPYTTPRPGHVDLNAAVKYGYADLRPGLERASARETVARVAAGALCRQLLDLIEIRIGGWVQAIGSVAAPPVAESLDEIVRRAETSVVRCPDEATSVSMEDAIREARRQRETLGGVIHLRAAGVPCGLGSHVQWDRRLDGRLAQILLSVPSVKGIEFGPAFDNARQPGSQVHDAIVRDDDGRLSRNSNRAGGLEGGVTTGADIDIRLALKPISTVMRGLDTVDLATGEPTSTVYERSDTCSVPRAVAVAENLLAWALTREVLTIFGPDTVDDVVRHWRERRQPDLTTLRFEGRPWTPFPEVGD